MLVALGASAAFLGCSSSSSPGTSFGGSSSGGTGGHAGTLGTGGHAGTISAGGTGGTGGTIGASGSVGVSGGGSTGVSGGGAGGATAGTGGASGGTGGAATGGGGAGGATGGTGGAATGGGGAGGGSGAIVTMCPGKTYTATATPGGVCAGNVQVPAVVGIANFDSGTAAGWGVYANGTGGTVTPTITTNAATPSAPGANGSAMALAYTVAGAAKGIRINDGYGMCQDVRTFTGLSFWAKGTVDAATTPTADFPVDANTLIITLGAEKSAQGGCTTGCLNVPDIRLTISSEWKLYEIPFNCFGDATVFDGYFNSILISEYGTNATFAIDEVSYYH
jgi:hypothetical protein